MPRLHLPDGRCLELQVTGQANGHPLLFVHATPGSGYPPYAVERAANELGLRLVTWSRPGYSPSPRLPERTIAAHSAEVESVLNFLQAPRCLIAGWSSGGPHALAAAALLPERISAVLTISSPAPLIGAPDGLRGMDEQSHAEFGAARQGEEALRDYLGSHLISAFSEIPLTAADQAVLTPTALSDLFVHYHHGLASGLDGWIDDDLALTGPWGFEPGEIRVPVHIWHGADDHRIPPSHARALAAAIPTGTANIQPGHGHLSLLLSALPTMLAGLTQVAD
jgi:pimeloyl-ACP methyl ester carboxylesterase